jgi:hypothetical protein
MSEQDTRGGYSRRTFLTTMIAGIAACGCGSSGGDDDTQEGGGAPPSPDSGRLRTLSAGCYSPAMAGFGSESIGCGIGTTFGDPWFDQRFIQELSLQSSFFSGFLPAVYVLDECSPNQANALSDPRGFVLFGKWLASKTIIETRSELPIAGILAHEWAHQVQFAYGWMQTNEPTVRRTELEADMWSGLYMGMAKNWAGQQMSAYFQTLFNLGDYQFNSPGHHGTPNQRLAAGATGLSVAQQLLSTGQRLSYADLHFLFDQEVNRITATVSGVVGSSGKAQINSSGLSYPLNVLGEKVDHDWITGIAAGQRSLMELERMPAVPEAARQSLYPY